jgi:NADP-dependent aldehyde dehydrogenase
LTVQPESQLFPQFVRFVVRLFVPLEPERRKRKVTQQPVLIDGQWRAADAVDTFRAENPATCEPLPEEYPISSWEDCDAALAAASRAFAQLRSVPVEQIAEFLEKYATGIEAAGDALVELAHAETALPASPRLADVELPRTTHQLRLAAQAARDRSWAPTTHWCAG